MSINDEVSAVVKEAIKEAIQTILSEESVWDEVDKIINEELNKGDCTLSFEEGRPEIFVGIGTGAGVKTFKEVDVYVETYNFAHSTSKAQKADIRQQIAGIDAFIKQLTEAKEELTKALVNP